MRRRAAVRTAAALALAAALTLAGCAADEPEAAEGPPDGPGVLRVLAGSELKDLEPLLATAADQAGVTFSLRYAGTLDGAEMVASGGADAGYDAIWFSSNRYLSLIEGANARLSTQTKIMASPVLLGLDQAKAEELGWTNKQVTWADIAKAAGEGRFTFGMTNPASSNSGFSALVGVAAALSDAGEALDAAAIGAVTPRLKEFFSAQRLTSGSSGWLADVYAAQGGVDGLVNYESVLLGLNRKLPRPLTLIYPSDGVVTADYPLTALASASPEKKELYTKAVNWLRSPAVQKEIMTRTDRRPIVPAVRPDSRFGTASLVELPFPNRRDTADGLIDAYLNQVRVPAQALFVLDTSGSMAGDRIEALRGALVTLTGADTSASGTFSRFRNREKVTMIPFSTRPGSPQGFTLPGSRPEPVLAEIKGYAEGLDVSGGTAIYDALRVAYEEAGRQLAADPGRYTSIVLMTDGENTDGSDYEEFERFYRALPEAQRRVRTFVVLFGESDVAEMTELARLTGGTTFDARSGSLAAAFKEIRGYQ
ncbi:Ca-activated chloride channel family protein [Thermocatellispora tengchongensis]|uniref:Ca-activated chloride channel family protein n=1 Tax=Thermocatellispora tengchongensis TaxID=1073253 RepID=A0A840NWP8_9ACTN|nr:VWA domain-containing protein [Thermocatellispora tengchongensis]MBB5131229.1 Ca-activated chloride channel family protein [Thermocatellispora tengchongensis]